MISFFVESVEVDLDRDALQNWVINIILSENKTEGDINYIFCTDEYLLKINRDFLSHDSYTDIISFDYTIGNELHGEIYISVDRVKENSNIYDVNFDEELRRVMAHGILHFCGYKDKSADDQKLMRDKEDEKLKMFHVER